MTVTALAGQRRSRSAVTKPSLEFILNEFRSRSGLYIVGAGASTGVAPLGADFWTATPVSFLRSFRGVSANIPLHSVLVDRILEYWNDWDLEKVFPDREARHGSDCPLREFLVRMPNHYARTHLKGLLAKAVYDNRRCDNYHVFRYFASSILANYNHDGLAGRFCGAQHRVLDMHGSVHPGYGSPEMMDFIDVASEYHLADAPDGILMGEPEDWNSPALARKLDFVVQASPTFIAVTGYTFARNAKTSAFDDWVSLCRLSKRFRGFRGNVYVVAPDPYDIQVMLSDTWKIRTVFAVRARWNLLAHAFMRALADGRERRSLSRIPDQLFDAFGGGAVFPLLDTESGR